jgi:DNA-binding winged helix-turn-helix (wHTH) protein/tetratricopeptide (TPR) repeat protein
LAADVAARGERIDLARAPPFRLGALQVTPALRQVARGEASQTLEPRVMQVLVALAGADGDIVGRAELVERCWDGRVVGENAINRVLSRLRALGAGLGAGCFEIETITKVGYRLRPAGAPAAVAAPDASSQPRRGLLLGVGAVAAAAVAVAAPLAWRAGPWRARPLASELYERGMADLLQDTRDSILQAVAYFRRAVEADPRSAQGWGGLALGYAAQLRVSGDEDLEAVAQACAAAAARALAAEPDNADALVALALVPPWSADWAAAEARLRALDRRFPTHEVLLAQTPDLLSEVGRSFESMRLIQQRLAVRPATPMLFAVLPFALWEIGDLDGAEVAFDQAVRASPVDGGLWLMRFHFLVLSDRTEKALAQLLHDETPDVLNGEPLDTLTDIARGLRQADARERTVAQLLALRARGAIQSPVAAMYLTQLGRFDAALDVLEAYFLGPIANGRRAGLSRLSRRSPYAMFVPPIAPLRAEPRFAALLDAAGLEAYWRKSSRGPDYRRAGPDGKAAVFTESWRPRG